jgi:hypothetical protein
VQLIHTPLEQQTTPPVITLSKKKVQQIYIVSPASQILDKTDIAIES